MENGSKNVVLGFQKLITNFEKFKFSVYKIFFYLLCNLIHIILISDFNRNMNDISCLVGRFRKNASSKIRLMCDNTSTTRVHSNI